MRRTYERTHPWLTFDVDTRRFPFDLWVALGEIASKVEHIAGVPLSPPISERMHQVYLAKGVLATTAIEGNTLSEEDVLQAIEGKLSLPPSREYLGREVENILGACNTIVRRFREEGVRPIDAELLCWMNEQVLKDLPMDQGEPGQLRQHPVVVGRYKCAPYEDCRVLTDKLCDVLNNFSVEHKNELVFSTIKAIFAHLYLVWIHPFADGNGRTARLLELYILLASSFPQPAAHLLSNHYNKTRTEYYRKLDAASRNPHGPTEFFQYAAQGLLDGLREQIEWIRYQQWDVAWVNFVHDAFRDSKATPADSRRRRLVLELSRQTEPVPLSKMIEVSTSIASAYRGRTLKTVTRDIRVLMRMDLVERVEGGYRARRQKILAFLPWRKRVGATAENEPAGSPPAHEVVH